MPRKNTDRVTLRLERSEKIAAIVGAVIALLSLLALIVSINDARRSVEIQNRPWLTIDKFTIEREPSVGAQIAVRTSFGFTGETPAFDVNTKTVSEIADHAYTIDWAKVPSVGRRVAITHDSPNLIGQSPTMHVGAEGAVAYATGLGKLFFQARIEYRDAFGRQHWTTVCVYHAPPMPLDQFFYCDSGNDMDRPE
jgi:hypothetical protein